GHATRTRRALSFRPRHGRRPRRREHERGGRDHTGDGCIEAAGATALGTGGCCEHGGTRPERDALVQTRVGLTPPDNTNAPGGRDPVYWRPALRQSWRQSDGVLQRRHYRRADYCALTRAGNSRRRAPIVILAERERTRLAPSRGDAAREVFGRWKRPRQRHRR